MALWLVRAGQSGEHEHKFLADGRVYLCWSGFNPHLSDVGDRDSLKELLSDTYPNFPVGKIRQNSGQIWAFAKHIAKGDWIVTPSKFGPTVHIAEVNGTYEHHPGGPDPYYHSIPVNWIAQDIPRANFDQDILYSLGAYLTICKIQRNDAENRVRKMGQNGWKSTTASLLSGTTGATEATDETQGDEDSQTVVDLEPQARDQIRRYVIARFKGYGMQTLVRKLLVAQGYTVHQPSEGPDKGIDLLAAPGPLGFGTPRIVVQVKSQESPVDRPTLDQLVGTMSNVSAERGLLVCWGGFKASVHKEEAQQFFKVRLWDSDRLLDQIFAYYDRLEDELKAEIPLKHMWTLATPD